MKKILFILVAVIVAGCDDGDIIFEDLSFTNVAVAACEPVEGAASNSYVFYKLDRTNNESISLELTVPDDLINTNAIYGPYTLNATNKIEYRKFNGQPPTDYFCNSVPVTTPGVTELYTSRNGGIVTIETTSETEDDNDGIPAETEGLVNDTDGDGELDYLDSDDDGDNIPTSVEGTIDSDGDGFPDYLDADDDNDGILTRDEDLNGDLDPTNDFVNGSLTPAYLDGNVQMTASPAITRFRPHTVQRSARVTILITGLTLTATDKEIVLDTYEFGSYINPVTQVTFTPNFVP